MIPVVLLTGFLGSGKTTLLNRILTHRQEHPSAGKLAILVNELGSIGIDASLLPPGAARQVELSGGCICCSLDENLAQSLNDLLDTEPAIEWVMVETTGVAEPLPIIWTLTGEQLGQRIRLAAVVTVVDALEHQRHRSLAASVDAQVEHADILVVSKLDALPPEERESALADLVAGLRPVNATAALIAESHPRDSAAALWQLLSDVEADTVLARSRPAHSRHAATSSGTRAAPAPDEHAPEAHAHHLSHGRPHGFDAIAVPIEGTLDFEELTSQLEALPAEYIRIKGICWAVDPQTGSDRRTLIAFHRVGARVSAEPLVERSGAEPIPCAVALGVGIEADRLAACVRAAMVGSNR
jgi:G3E family GTPase